MRILSIIAVIIVFCSTGCKREPYLEPVEGVPVFTISGTIDGNPFEMNAGREQVYINSALARNQFGVNEFRSEFVDLNCNQCPPLFGLVVKDDHVSDPDEPTSVEVFSADHLEFASASDASNFLSIHFNASSEEGIDYAWNFGDGQSGFGQSQDHTYENPGIYQVTLQVNNGPGPGDDLTIIQSILAGNDQPLSVPFVIDELQDDYWRFFLPDNLPEGLELLHWSVNGQQYYTDELEVEIDSPSQVCAHFHNSQINESGTYCVVFSGEYSIDNDVVFEYHWQAQQTNLSKVELRYRHTNGIVYHSLNELNTDPLHDFQILNMSDYEGTINGKLAKLVEASFDVYLQNENDPNDIIHMQNVMAKLGFVVEN